MSNLDDDKIMHRIHFILLEKQIKKNQIFSLIFSPKSPQIPQTMFLGNIRIEIGFAKKKL